MRELAVLIETLMGVFQRVNFPKIANPARRSKSPAHWFQLAAEGGPLAFEMDHHHRDVGGRDSSDATGLS